MSVRVDLRGRNAAHLHRLRAARLERHAHACEIGGRRDRAADERHVARHRHARLKVEHDTVHVLAADRDVGRRPQDLRDDAAAAAEPRAAASRRRAAPLRLLLRLLLLLRDGFFGLILRSNRRARRDRVLAGRDAGEDEVAVLIHARHVRVHARHARHVRLAHRRDLNLHALRDRSGRAADRALDARRRHELQLEVDAAALFADRERDRRRGSRRDRAGVVDRRVGDRLLLILLLQLLLQRVGLIEKLLAASAAATVDEVLELAEPLLAAAPAAAASATARPPPPGAPGVAPAACACCSSDSISAAIVCRRSPSPALRGTALTM